MYGKDESVPKTNIIKPKPGKYGSNSSSVKGFSLHLESQVVQGQLGRVDGDFRIISVVQSAQKLDF